MIPKREFRDTVVVNLRHERYDIYIGRGSKWGNPFSHMPGTKALYVVSTREEAIQAHKDWLMNGEGRKLLDNIGELRGKRLGCYCKPKPCHGDIYAELANAIAA